MTFLRDAVTLAVLASALLAPGRGARGQSFGDEGPPPSTIAPAPAPGSASAGAPAAPTPLTVLDGIVRSLDLAGHAVVLEVGGAPVTLGVDRNTLVYLPAGLTTILALRPGDRVRAGRNGKDVAYWIEVQRQPGAKTPPPSTPGQGTGPGGGSPSPAEGAAPVRPPGSSGTPR